MTSHAAQDRFVLCVLGAEPNTYLEIGAGHPTDISNTHLLELLGWRGLSVDNGAHRWRRWFKSAPMRDRLEKLWSVERKNEFMLADATQLDYEALLSTRQYPARMGYLSLDIDDYTTQALARIDFLKRTFSVITAEHCVCNGDNKQQQEQRTFFESEGYVLACADVCHAGQRFEDWWLSPEVFDPTLHPQLEGKDCEEIIKLYEVARATESAKLILGHV